MRHPGILIVDDEEGIRELVRRRLEKQGYVCYTAPNGYEALEVLATEAVDLALVDVMMPSMTGLSLFQHVRESYPDVAVIFSTAVDDLSLAVEHIKKGAYDYVVKPVTQARLQRAVEEPSASATPCWRGKTPRRRRAGSRSKTCLPR